MENQAPPPLKKFFMNETLYDYMVSHSVRELPILRDLRAKTNSMRGNQMISPAEQGQFLQFLIKILNPQSILEVGVFTGYSTLCMALASRDETQIVGLEINNDFADVSTPFWEKANVSNKINCIYGDALVTMQEMLTKPESYENHPKTYDFIFLDADKERYEEYYELGLKLLNQGGIMMIDNVFTWGLVADKTKNKRLVQKIRLFNKHVHEDARVDITMLPMADGFTLVRKR